MLETEEKVDDDVLHEIMADISIYLNPELLLGDVVEKVKEVEIDKEKMEKYQELFQNIHDIRKKLSRYPLYFEKFYPPDESGIEDSEALDHHVTAYLEDLATLKNKMTNLLGSMKNDIKGNESFNRDEIETFFEKIKETITLSMQQVKEHRDPHRHGGKRFRDGELLEAGLSQIIIEMTQDKHIADMFNPESVPEIIRRETAKKKDAFQRARKRWINMANENEKKTTGLLNYLLEDLRPILYHFLNIYPVKSLMDDSHDK